MASKEEVPVFTETNLGTRLVVSVPSEITAGHFKRELETVHFKCFPGSGEIEVYGLMVKKRSFFYYLPNSIPMKCAFYGVRGTWFVQAEAKTSSERLDPHLLDLVSNDVDCMPPNNGNISNRLEAESSAISIDKSNTTGAEEKYGEKELQSQKPPIEERTISVYISKKKKKKNWKNCILDYKDNGDEKKLICASAKPLALTANKISNSYLSVTEVEPRYQEASGEMTDATTEMFSEVKSVTSIIRRYFPSSSEMKACPSPASSDVTSKLHSRRQKRLKTRRNDVDSFPMFSGHQHHSNFLPRCLPTGPSHGTSKGKTDGVEVGKRLVVASDNLGISSSKKLSPAYLCRSRDRKVKALDLSSSLIKKSIFEISDSDD